MHGKRGLASETQNRKWPQERKTILETETIY